MSFQSRLGKTPWITPYTDHVLEKLGQEGRSVDVIYPGFAADCLETLEEISIQNAERFTEAGGKAFHYIPALNISKKHIELIKSLV